MDPYIVSARKYRPETFDSVVGQASITLTLRNAIKNKQLGHAYLFCGPRGVGKTTCARIFAKAINCTQLTAETEPCNQCESCRSFNESRAYNIHELDAASNNSVEDIRNLTDRVRIPPQVGRYSVYIIDEVHMLSTQAFNAFLKTLEEPPGHAIFILATTEKHKIIPTILSRCQIFDFSRIRVEDIVGYLEGISDKENVDYEVDALNVIALKADGAMRDALSIFDQVISYAGPKIGYQNVIEHLSILDYEYYFRITGHFLEGDIPGALMLFDEILGKGFDAHNFLGGLGSHMRDLLVCRDPVTLELLEVGAGIRDKYREQSQLTGQDWLYHAISILGEADIAFRASRNQRLHTELTLLRLCKLAGADKKKVLKEPAAEPEPEPEIVADPNTGPGSVTGPEPEPEPEPGSGRDTGSCAEPASRPATGKSGTRPAVKRIGGSIPSIKDAINGIQKPGPGDAPEPDEEKASRKDTLSEPFTQEDLLKGWTDFAEKIKADRPRMASSLRHHLPSLKDDLEIEVILSNSAQFEQFDREIKTDLILHLESALKNNQFRIKPVLAKIEDQQKTLYTPEEKFGHMLKKNPELARLKERFNLDFE